MTPIFLLFDFNKYQSLLSVSDISCGRLSSICRDESGGFEAVCEFVTLVVNLSKALFELCRKSSLQCRNAVANVSRADWCLQDSISEIKLFNRLINMA